MSATLPKIQLYNTQNLLLPAILQFSCNQSANLYQYKATIDKQNTLLFRSKFQDDIWLLGGRRGGGMGKGKEDGELIEKKWGRELLL